MLPGDLDFTPESANVFVDICREEKFPQPSLDHQSYFWRYVTLQQPFLRHRIVNFVEVMVPCFRTDLLDRLLPSFVLTKLGWGIDYTWYDLLDADSERMAVVDAVSVTHTRPIGGTLYKNNTFEVTRLDEMNQVQASDKAVEKRQGFEGVVSGLWDEGRAARPAGSRGAHDAELPARERPLPAHPAASGDHATDLPVASLLMLSASREAAMALRWNDVRQVVGGWIVLILLLSTVLILPGLAAAEVPDARYARLRSGVNLSHWYAQSIAGLGEDHLSSYVTPADAALIRKNGFAHVRLPVAPSAVFREGFGGDLDAGKTARLIERIRWLMAADLAVVVELHPGEDEKRELLKEEGASRLAAGWKALARALSTLSPDLVFLEVLNEPDPLKAEAWRSLQERIVREIRSEAPRHTLVLNAGGWSGIDDLVAFEPLADRNAVYTVHWYGPLLFTHQGADWSWGVAEQVAGLGWPLEPGVGDLPERTARTEEARGHLRYQIQEGQFRAGWMDEQFDKLALWQERHGGARVYVGEFGVFRKVAPPTDRLRWHRASRQGFEARGWGWAVWDFAGGFGIVTGPAGSRTIDRAMLEALGQP